MLDIISKNVSQSEADRNIILNTVTTPFVYYTCPPGKRARVKGWVRCVDRGGSGNASFEANGVVLWIWSTAVAQNSLANTYITTPESLTTAQGGQTAFMDLILEAGQDIRAIQSAGFTNAQFKINVKVRELPV